MDKVRYLIIGNGIAGLSAAKEIRSRDNDGSIMMISREKYPTYYRMRLTEALGKDLELEDLLVNQAKWYRDNNIQLILEKSVEKVLPEENKVLVEDGLEIKYEKLLIATGSRPFIPPISGSYKEGVFALRGINDLDEIKNYFKNRDRIIIIGGGLLGLEAAWALRNKGKKLIVIESAPFLLPRQVDKELGKRLEGKLGDMGIDIYTSLMVEQIVGKDGVTGIIVNGGESIPADGILISTGIIPNIDSLENTGIKTNRGIIVDKHLRTNFQDIYAAGDVAEYDNIVLGLWTASNEQGKIAGHNITGGELEYTHPKPFATLRMGDIQLFSAGDILDYHHIYEYKENEDIHHKIFVKDGKIKGAVLFGDIRKMATIKNAVFSNQDINIFIEEFPFKMVK